MESLRKQFVKEHDIETYSDFNEAYITWLETKLTESDDKLSKLSESDAQLTKLADDKKRLIEALAIVEKLTYTESEVQKIVVDCYSYTVDCIKNRISFDKIPSMIVTFFDTIKKNNQIK